MTSVARLGLECNRNLAVYDRYFYYVYDFSGTIGTSVKDDSEGSRAVISSRKLYHLSTLTGECCSPPQLEQKNDVRTKRSRKAFTWPKRLPGAAGRLDHTGYGGEHVESLGLKRRHLSHKSAGWYRQDAFLQLGRLWLDTACCMHEIDMGKGISSKGSTNRIS